MGNIQPPFLILTECGRSVGYGHFSRCLSIAHEFLAKGRECLIVIDEKSSSFKNHDDRIKILCRRWIRDPRKVRSLMLAANGIVVDAITAPLRTVWEITRSNPNVAIIDDWHRRNHRKGLVIDWTVGAEEFAYRKKNLGVRYLLGSKYCTIRPAFSNRKQKLIRTRIIRVLLTFGGSDPRGMTTVVSSLLDHHYPDVIQEIVLGPGVDDKISRHFEKHSTSNKIIHRRCSESLMRSLMETADLAVTAGGQTLYELACVGTPTVCIEVVDNQRDDIREFEKKAFLANAGRWSDPRLDSSILAKIRGLQSHDARKAASIKGRKIVDGNGAKRLVSSCLDEWGE